MKRLHDQQACFKSVYCMAQQRGFSEVVCLFPSKDLMKAFQRYVQTAVGAEGPCWAMQLFTFEQWVNELSIYDRASQRVALPILYQAYLEQKPEDPAPFERFLPLGRALFHAIEALHTHTRQPWDLWKNQPTRSYPSADDLLAGDLFKQLHVGLPLIAQSYFEQMARAFLATYAGQLIDLIEHLETRHIDRVSSKKLFLFGALPANQLEQLFLKKLARVVDLTQVPLLVAENDQMAGSANPLDTPITHCHVPTALSQYPSAVEKITDILKAPPLDAVHTPQIALILESKQMLSHLLTYWPEQMPLPYVAGGISWTQTPLYTLFDQLIRVFSMQRAVPSPLLHQLATHPWLQPHAAAVLAALQARQLGTPFKEALQALPKVIKELFELLADPPINFWRALSTQIGALYTTQGAHTSLEKAAYAHSKYFFEQLAESPPPYAHGSRFWREYLFDAAQRERLSYQVKHTAPVHIFCWNQLPTYHYPYLIALDFTASNMPIAGRPNLFFGAPTYWENVGFPSPAVEQAKQINQFKQLLGAARTCWLFSPQNELSGNQSRLSVVLPQIQQLQGRSYQAVHLKERAPLPPSRSLQPVEIPHSRFVERALKRFEVSAMGSAALSPSALILYANCPLQFYLRYVAQAKEVAPIWPNNPFEPAYIGAWAHGVLEQLYRPLLRQKITKASIEQALKRLDQLLLAVKEQVSNRDMGGVFPPAMEQLCADAVREIVKAILKKDLADVPFYVLAVEHRIKHPIRLLDGRSVWLQGIIDRIDLKNNQIRLVDYKTGQPQRTLPEVKNWFKPSHRTESGLGIQMGLYSWLYRQNPLAVSHQVGAIQPVVRSFRQATSFSSTGHLLAIPSLEDPSKRVACADFSPYIGCFENGLQPFLSEIWSKETIFKHPPPPHKGAFQCTDTVWCMG